MKRKYFVNIGEKYGKWTILKIDVFYLRPDGYNVRKILCVCECGRESIIEAGKLINGTIKSCRVCSKIGRIYIDRKPHLPISEETREKMRISSKNNPKIKASQFKKGIIPFNKGKKMPQITGENHYLWKKDRNELKRYENSKERRSPAYAYWRKIVTERDCYKCKIGNIDCKGRLEVHHILGFKKFPELKYDINNGITLCRFHHPLKRKDEEKLSPYFQQLVAENK